VNKNNKSNIAATALFPILSTIFSSALLANAGGGGASIYEVGTPDMGMSYAGAGARASDAGTAYLNPAGMSFLEVDKFDLLMGAFANYINFHFELGESAVGMPTSARGDGGSAGGLIPGGALYFVKPLNNCWTLGFTVNAPYAAALKYGEGWLGRNYLTEIFFLGVNFEPSISFKMSEDFSIGLGLNFIYGYLPTYKLKATPLQNAANIEVDASDWDWGFTLGGFYKYTQYTQFGFTYKSGIKLKLDGDLKIPSGTNLQFNQKTKLPQGFSLSMSHELSEQLKVLGDVGWTDWSEYSFQNVGVNNAITSRTAFIDRHWKDTWRIAGGVEYQWDSCLTVRTGLSYDSNPANKSFTLPDTPLGSVYRLSFGFSLNLDQGYILSSSYTYAHFNNVKASNVTLPFGAVFDGKYDSASMHYVGLTLEIK